jgi:hypothetical protein
VSDDVRTFFEFFKRSPVLSQFFDTEQKANIFYTKIRCGLLHQGQTKGKSLIHIRDSEPILRWIDDTNIEEGLSIQRRLFLIEIQGVFEAYINELRKPNNQNSD